MNQSQNNRKSQSGLSIIENMVALVILTVAAMAIGQQFSGLSKSINRSAVMLAPESMHAILDTYISTSMGSYWDRQNFAVNLCPRLRNHIATSLLENQITNLNTKIELISDPIASNSRHGSPGTPYVTGVSRCNRILAGNHNTNVSGISGSNTYSSLHFCLRLSPIDNSKADGQIHEVFPALVEARYDLMDLYRDTRRLCSSFTANTSVPGIRFGYRIYWLEKTNGKDLLPHKQLNIIYTGK